MVQRTHWAAALFAVLIGGAVSSAPASADLLEPITAPSPDGGDALRYVGPIENGAFQALGCGGGTVPFLLTTIARQEARSVESGALDLSPFERRMVVIEGIPNGGWVYEARVIETIGSATEPFIRLMAERCNSPKK